LGHLSNKPDIYLHFLFNISSTVAYANASCGVYTGGVEHIFCVLTSSNTYPPHNDMIGYIWDEAQEIPGDMGVLWKWMVW
jgi:hypothetical protein